MHTNILEQLTENGFVQFKKMFTKIKNCLCSSKGFIKNHENLKCV
jgi:hypothetical protein